ncbi:MAG: hypothetical protein ABI647_05650 [Gemmatimonadota bacterium]
MPLGYTINRNNGYVLVVYRGNPTIAQWTAVMRRALSDPAYQTGFGFLLDRRLAKGPPTTPFVRATLAFSEANRARLGASRWAVVVTDAASFGMARMGQILAEHQQIGAFTDMASAEAWLRGGRPRDIESPLGE